MFKIQKNKIKIFIPIIILLIGTIYFLYNKLYESEESTYLINKDFILYGTNNEQNNNLMENNNIKKNKIVIHIIGEVVNEGIVEIDEGARIVDAVNSAGGLTEYADTSKINLAYVLKDGQKVIIPSINDTTAENEFVLSGSGDDIIKGDSDNTNDGLININTATKQELQTLPGVGESTAQKIINYRNENGEFENIEDIKNVSGIGDSKFNSIKDLITV